MRNLFIALCLIPSLLLAGSEDPFKKPMIGNAVGDGSGFAPGKFYVSAGIGAINLNSILANKIKTSLAPNWKNIEYHGSPAWFVKAEYALSGYSGVGITYAQGGFDIDAALPDSFTKLNIPISGNLKYKTWSLQARYNFHFIRESNLDVYAGVGVGFRSNNFKVTDNDPDRNWWNFPVNLNFAKKIIPNSLNLPTIAGDFTVGARYFIAPPLALYAEFGLAKSIAQGGLVLRF